MLILFVGVWLLDRHRPKGDNEEYVTINLTIDGDSEDEQGISETATVYELVYVCNLLCKFCRLVEYDSCASDKH